MFLKRKFLVIIALIILVCIVAVSSTISPTALPTSTNIITTPKIILDAGHAGFS